KRVRADAFRDLINRQVRRDQLLAVGRIYAIVARPGDWSRADSKMDGFRSGVPDHRDESARRGSANDRVVHHHHALSFEQLPDSVVFDFYLRVAAGLRRLDESPSDVVIPDERVLQGKAGLLRKAERRGVGTVRNGEHK